MMFFGLLGLAALVIDLGFARLTQRQMQSAVDSAALEGLRGQAAAARTPPGQTQGSRRTKWLPVFSRTT